jgi:predicted phosphodiesterase
MKVANVKVGPRFNLYPISDVHFPNHDDKRLSRWVETVAADPDAIVTLGGDIFDFARTTFRTYVNAYQADQTSRHLMDHAARESIGKLAMKLAPVRDKIVGAISGNHHWRFPNGLISDQELMILMGLSDRWFGDAALIRVDMEVRDQLADVPVKILLHHDGGSGAGTLGGQMNAFVRGSNRVDADIICYGHSHGLYNLPGATKITVPDTGEPFVTDKVVIFVRSGTFMKAWTESVHDPLAPHEPDYAETKLLPPSALGAATVEVKLKLHRGVYKPDYRLITDLY